MTDLRTAAQQALADLKDLHKNHNITYAGTISRLEAALAQEQATPPGCDHCNHPLYAATKCRVCGRVTEQAEPERHFCERCGKRLSQDGVHTCTPPQQIEQAMLGVWQDVPGAVNFGITDPAAPRCLYPDCVGGKQGTICHDSCPGGNPSFG